MIRISRYSGQAQQKNNNEIGNYKALCFSSKRKKEYCVASKRLLLKTTWKLNHHDYNRDWKNLNLPSWKSGLTVIKILTVLDKISACHQKNLNVLSSNSQIVIIGNSICYHENVQLFIIKCRPAIMKISTVCNKFWNSQNVRLLTGMSSHILLLHFVVCLR